MAKTRGKASRDSKDTPSRPLKRGGAPGDARVPGWLPPSLFLVLTLVLFRGFIFSDQMLLGGDTLGLGYVARLFYAQALKAGEFPLWNPEILGGTPFLEALSGGDSLYPPSALLLWFMEPYRALGWKLVLHIIAAGFFMFGWVRSVGVSRAAALVSATGYMLAPMLVSFIRPGHDGKLFVMALAPLLFWAVERHFLRPGLKSFAAMGLVVALVLFTTHFQMAYFLFGGVGMFAIFRMIQLGREGGIEGGPAASTEARATPEEGSTPAAPSNAGKAWRVAGLRFGLFLAASVAGAAGAAVQFIPSAAYVTEYSRRVQTTHEDAGGSGRAWSSSWSLHPEEAMNLVIPEFSGNNAGGSAWTSGTYWGRNGWKDNIETAGVLFLLLAAVSFAGARRKGLRYFMAGLGAVSLLFALGTHTPVWGLFYALVPGIKLFRSPSMVMFLFVFATGTLAALGFDRILRAVGEGTDEGWKGPMRVLWGGTGVLALLWVMAASGVLLSLWTSVVYRGMDPQQLQLLDRARPFIAQGAFVATALTALLGGVVWMGRKGLANATAVLAGVVLLVAVDQLRVDGSFVQTMDFYAWSQPGPNIQALLERERDNGEPYRLWSMARRSQGVDPAMHGIELVAGHHPNDLSRYRELIGMVGSEDATNLYNANIRQLLNVRYLLWPDIERGPGPEGGEVSRTRVQDGRTYETLYAAGGLPRARLVAAATVKADDEAVPYMLSQDFDPAAEVVLAQDPPVPLGGGPVAGGVAWELRSNNRLRLSVTSDRPALLVIADNWFPAWRASVDGADAPVLRAYHSLRAVPVPAGSSTVEMWYHSDLLTRSMWLSLLVLAALACAGALGLARDRRRAA